MALKFYTEAKISSLIQLNEEDHLSNNGLKEKKRKAFG